jgi:TPR repeat protein
MFVNPFTGEAPARAALICALAVTLAVPVQAKLGDDPKSRAAVQQTEINQRPVDEVRAKAETGDADSEFQIGLRYFYGHGVPKDLAEAAKWFRKAAEQGFAFAQAELAWCYDHGHGVPKDFAEAAKWLRKAAEQNLAVAQYNLGIDYAHGHGVPKDFAEAMKWFRKAAEQGFADASYMMGIGYNQGQGVPTNKREAAKWFRRAAEQGFADAQLMVGTWYDQGEGVAKDQVAAYKWYLLAAAQGNDVAKKMVSLSEGLMTQEQIADGQKLARNFKPRTVPSAGNDSSSAGNAQSPPQASGTGFFITGDGYLITNEHVAGAGAQVRLVTATGIISAKVFKVDGANDLALLKAEGKFAALPVAMSRPVKLGDTVATVGFPNVDLQGFAPKFARGEIGSLSGPQDDARYFQISVPVQPGNSGGALVDERGNVVGIVSAKLNAKEALSRSGALPENVNYAVKSSFLLSFLESVPDVAAKLKEPNAKDVKFADVVEQAKEAAVLVLVY